MAQPFNPGTYHVVGGQTYARLKMLDIANSLLGQDPNIRKCYCDNFALDLYNMGNAEEICGLEYSHFEEDYEASYPKIQATTAGASANNEATFTFAPTPQGTSLNPYGQILEYPNSASPFGASTGYDKVGVPVQVNDVIHIPNLAGTVSMDTYIDAIVTDVDINAGTFKAIPLVAGEAIPAMATPTELAIIDKVNSIFGCDYECTSLDTQLKEYKNNLQDLKFCFEGDTDIDQLCKTLMLDGKPYLGMREHLIPKFMEIAKRKINFALFLGQNITNPNVISLGENKLRTRGLIPEILQRGVVEGYSPTTGFDKEDLRSLALQFKERHTCPTEYIIYAGYKLMNSINDTFGASTSSQYQTLFSGCEPKCYENSFTYLADMGYAFHIKELALANETQSLGATGYSYSSEGIVIPVGNAQVQRKTSDGGMERALAPYLTLKYFKGKFMDESIVDMKTINHCDKMSVALNARVGLDVACANAFGIIKVQ